ncbi:MAG TPA: DUF2007 domain-containing protein [Gemmatales bacterium]|nr:DUF2007 domain-containing protein [Gemmatales bacterium]
MKNEPVIAFSTNQFAEAEILKNMPESEGIQCLLEGEHQAGFTGILEIRGMVSAWDEVNARMLLDKRNNHSNHDQPPSKISKPVAIQPGIRQDVTRY